MTGQLRRSRAAAAAAIALVLLLSSCASPERRCSDTLQPINAPAPAPARNGADDER